jgi:hypothetical protein
MTMLVWTFLTLLSMSTYAQEENEGLRYFETVSKCVERLKIQAASPDNGWNLVASFLANKGEPTDSGYEEVSRRGEALSQRREAQQTLDPSEVRRFVQDFQPYFLRIEKAASSHALLFPYRWDKIPASSIYSLVSARRMARCLEYWPGVS